jgi:hypothetical protein
MRIALAVSYFVGHFLTLYDFKHEQLAQKTCMETNLLPYLER